MSPEALTDSGEKQKPLVYFAPLSKKAEIDELQSKTQTLLREADFSRLLSKDAFTGIKQHFGEKGTEGFIKPQVTRVVVDFIKLTGAKPLLVETNTLYRGARWNSYDHLMLAYEHGFTPEQVGAPVLIMDGLRGQNQMSVPIKGEHFSEVNVVPDLPFFDALFVLTHVKGHMMSGMGGALKNLSMGFSSRAGKLAQHADFVPAISTKKCTRCGMCVRFCPEDALSIGTDAVILENEKCIGCGECYAVCRFGAISFRFGAADRKLQEKMAEYALGAVSNHQGKAAYLNYFCHLTKHCDCWDQHNPVLYPDVGIFASLDPVAIDQAAYDMAKRVFSKDVFREFWPELEPLIQLEHAEKIGLGKRDYRLRELAL